MLLLDAFLKKLDVNACWQIFERITITGTVAWSKWARPHRTPNQQKRWVKNWSTERGSAMFWDQGELLFSNIQGFLTLGIPMESWWHAQRMKKKQIKWKDSVWETPERDVSEPFSLAPNTDLQTEAQHPKYSNQKLNTAKEIHPPRYSWQQGLISISSYMLNKQACIPFPRYSCKGTKRNQRTWCSRPAIRWVDLRKDNANKEV